MSSMTPSRRNGLMLVALLFGQLLLMTGSVHRADGSTKLEILLASVSQPVVSLARGVASGIRGLFTGFADLREARGENRRLRADVHRLQNELNLAREQRIENERLVRLLMMKEQLEPESVAARLITANLSDEQHLIVIDRGADDGVRVDQAVLAWGGVVGRVVFVNSSTAKIRLLTDPGSRVAGISQRTRQNGTIAGRGSGLLEMLYVPSYAEIARGDRIITAGIDGVFPKGYGLGRVVQIGESSAIQKSILVEPEVAFSKLEDVLVLIGGESP